ncbi:MAG: elongation factor Ts [Bacteroidetes bacterium]|nr:MAG: elongation factor Ts [Bacteroidota bacterium]
MANITAAQVNELRKQTGAGMMDCKKALVESEGDFEKAIDILRKTGQKLASNRADRDANEGVVLSKTTDDNKTAAVIMFNCETDFVAKNQEIIDFTNMLLELGLEKGCKNVDELKSLEVDGRKVEDKVIDMIGKTGEKLNLSKFQVVTGERAFSYNHPGNRVASIAAFNKDVADEQTGKDVVMQIAAMAPVALDKESVSEEVIAKEIEIGKDIARQEGKPEEMLEKIAMGKLNKFFKESTLLNQDFYKDTKKTVQQMLTETDKGLTVVDFKRFALS